MKHLQSMRKSRLLISLGVLVTMLSACTNEAPVERQPNQVIQEDWYNVAFLVMDGVYNTELTAPFDIFHHTRFRDNIKPMNVFLVAETMAPVTSFEGLKIMPDYAYTSVNLPRIDVLVVPSAEHHLDTDLKNETMLQFVRNASEQAQFVTSHCDGAFVLAESGVLDGVVSTTFPADIETYRQRYPNLDVRDSVWFVHDGKFITSAGGARSFEAALYLSDILYGKEISRDIAKGLVIDWELDSVPHYIHN